MSRVLAVVACGISLAACSSSWMPSFELPSMPSFGGSSAGAAASLAVESNPPGAEARASGGAACRTPCRLNITADSPFTVTVALNGYVPQTVPVQVMRPDDPRLGSEDAASAAQGRLDPNPVYVELERAPPQMPAPPKKKSTTPRHAPTAMKRTPTNTATQAPAAPSAPTTAVGPNSAPPPAPAQQPNSGAAPWPMPR